MVAPPRPRPRVLTRCRRPYCGGQLHIDDGGDVRCLLCARRPGDTAPLIERRLLIATPESTRCEPATETELGVIIRSWRLDEGLSVRAAATVCNLSESHILLIERGRIRYLKPETLRKVSQGTGLSSGQLLAAMGVYL